MGFPVFCRGIHPADSLGRLDVAEHDVPIDCGDVLVRTGDLVVADDDGIVIVPQGIADRAIDLAEEKVRGENLVRQALAEGMSVTEAFRRYGVL
jgi:regulator of RNase E activity RraA